MAIFRIFLGVQGGPSGCRTLFVDIKLKVLPLYELLMLKSNSYFNVNKRLSATRWGHPVLQCISDTRSLLFVCFKVSLITDMMGHFG